MNAALAPNPTYTDMLIPHPLLGLRDSAEFVYLGDAKLLLRPNADSETAADEFHDYLHLRDNPAGLHKELWFHEYGDRSWLVVTRNTLTHEISDVQLARDVVMANSEQQNGQEHA